MRLCGKSGIEQSLLKRPSLLRSETVDDPNGKAVVRLGKISEKLCLRIVELDGADGPALAVGQVESPAALPGERRVGFYRRGEAAVGGIAVAIKSFAKQYMHKGSEFPAMPEGIELGTDHDAVDAQIAIDSLISEGGAYFCRSADAAQNFVVERAVGAVHSDAGIIRLSEHPHGV